MSDSLNQDEPPQPQGAHEYRVLARKYRPQTFGELIGQDAMVTTLGNAIKRGRLAHAFLLTGVRGVGKTSTARLIAKALNCIGPDGTGGPTIETCGVCKPCVTIAEGRNVDVIEMDAASHTGVDDMRSVIDISRNTAFERFQIFVIDEVHMLSKNAFNALLKTLEEPPENVKFILATTEVNKVPVTVLSRCQRFDLRRISGEQLAAHFAKVAEAEGVSAEPEALALIARAAEGSARDGLSILDQAIAHAGLKGANENGGVTAGAVRDMLGLSDRSAIRDLLGLLLNGDARGALAALRRQYDHGVDPASVLRALLEAVHGTTLTKLGASVDSTQSGEERAAYTEWAGKLSFPALHRLWQLFLKGHDEVTRAAMPIEAAEMALLRVVHAASLPDPGELLKKLEAGAGSVAPARPAAVEAAAPSAAPAASALPADLAALVELLAANGRHQLSVQVDACVRAVAYAPPEIVISTAKPIPADLIRDLTTELKVITGQTWRISTADAPGVATLRETREAAVEEERQAALATPVVQAALAAFPEAILESWPRKQA